MERPDLSKVSKEVREYIEDQEEKVAAFSADDTIANLYIGLKKQLDDVAVIFCTLTMTEADLKDKDDKGSDRYFKYLEKSKVLAENLRYIQNMIAPDKIEEAKIRKDAFLEQYLKDNPEEAG